LYFDLHMGDITGAEIIKLVRQLLHHLRGPLVLLWTAEEFIGVGTFRSFSNAIPG
jgi:hypothetical protein